MSSPAFTHRLCARLVLTLVVLLLGSTGPRLHAAEEFKLTPEQMQSLEATRKGFGKGKKLQTEIEKLMGQAAETNRAHLAVKLATVVTEKWPDEAADAIGKLVQLQPGQAVRLVQAALKIAPKQARAIASAAMTASPANSILIATAAIQSAPAEGNGILEAASWRVPKELKPQLEQLKASMGSVVTSAPKPVKIENPVRQ